MSVAIAAGKLAANHIDHAEEIVEQRCDNAVAAVAVPAAVVVGNRTEGAASSWRIGGDDADDI